MDEPELTSEDKHEGDRRERSTIGFPYDDLDSAIEVARGVHACGGSCGTDQLAAELRYSSVDNGAFRSRISTARHFGLISVSRGSVALTDLGSRVVDPQSIERAKAEAFLAVPLYRAVHEEYRGYTLPPTHGLEAKFVELGVAAKQKDKARQAFHRSAQQAGFFSKGTNRLVEPTFTPVGDSPNNFTEQNGWPATQQSATWSTQHEQQHPLIKGLMETLPSPGSVWSDGERKEWLRAAESIFALIYKAERPALPAGDSYRDA